MGRVYPNPKTRRVLGVFFIPEATRTRIFQKSTYPKVPEPENVEVFIYPKLPESEIQTRGYPTGLETQKIGQKSAKFGPKSAQNWP